MLIILPLGTDAPIYHWPRTTVAMIVINVAVFLFGPSVISWPSDDEVAAAFEDEGEEEGDVEPADPEDDEEGFVDVGDDDFGTPVHTPYALEFGKGWHPLQWVTHNFLHLDIFHLIGNMIFLWSFGIIVEGKIGWWKFLLLYLGIGTAHGALVQTLMLRFAQGGWAVGASAVIFGLLAICLIWAPKNDLSCFVCLIAVFRIFANMFDISILWFAGFHLFFEGLDLLLHSGIHGFPAISALGHLSGALWGVLVGIGMLKAGWVDCEHWDIFAVIAGRKGLAPDDPRAQRKPKPPVFVDDGRDPPKKKRRRDDDDGDEPREDRGAIALRRVQKLIENGDTAAAKQAYRKHAATLPDWPGETELYALIKSLHLVGEWEASIPPMRDYCRRFPDRSDKVRLKLAQILIKDLQRPAQALRVLDGFGDGPLPSEIDRLRVKLVQQAEQLRAEGVLELEGDD